jgi:hypothetical protein
MQMDIDQVKRKMIGTATKVKIITNITPPPGLSFQLRDP